MWYVSSVLVNPPINLDQVVAIHREDDRLTAFTNFNHIIKFSTSSVPIVWKYDNPTLRDKEWEDLMALITTKEESKQRKRAPKKEA